jgi:hypothetical protein
MPERAGVAGCGPLCHHTERGQMNRENILVAKEPAAATA